MGDWAEWADWANAITQTQVHFPSSFKAFRRVEKCDRIFFRSVATCGTKNHFSTLGCDWLINHGYGNGKALFSCHNDRERTKNKVLFQFFNMLKSFEWGSDEVPLCLQLHSPSQPIAPIPPSRPFMGEVGHGATVAPRMGQKVAWPQLYLTIYHEIGRFHVPFIIACHGSVTYVKWAFKATDPFSSFFLWSNAIYVGIKGRKKSKMIISKNRFSEVKREVHPPHTPD